MRYDVRFYSTWEGEKPVRTFLEDLRERKKDRVLVGLVTAGIKKLEQSEHHGPPLTGWADKKAGILELRVGHKDIARVFFFFRPGQRIIMTNGYVKKGQKLDPKELEKAKRYKRDWEERFP